MQGRRAIDTLRACGRVGAGADTSDMQKGAPASSSDDAEQTTANPPKPWWKNHPDIDAMVADTLAALESAPERPPIARTAADLQILREYFDDPDEVPLESSASSNDDAGQSTAAPRKPWWQDHPELEAIVARSNAEIESRPERPPIDYPDPMLDDIWTGRSVRELRDARDDLARAKTRYDNAIRAARNVSLSWGQIGGILGISRQQLHRRYRSVSD